MNSSDEDLNDRVEMDSDELYGFNSGGAQVLD